MIVYGIPNCDTVKKARAWLTAQGVDHRFHDFKQGGVPEAALARWIALLGWQPLLNRKGTTWRKLDAAVQQAAGDEAGAVHLMRAQASVIKRPVVEWPDGAVTVGFDVEDWARRTSPR